MGVLQPGGGSNLGEETFAAERGSQFGEENLDGDVAVMSEVMGEVDGGHPAASEFAHDPIAISEGERQVIERTHTEDCARREAI